MLRSANARRQRGTMSDHKYKNGQLVKYLGRESASGTYKITQLLPPEGDDFQYWIKKAREPHERVAKEHELGRAACPIVFSITAPPLNCFCQSAQRASAKNIGVSRQPLRLFVTPLRNYGHPKHSARTLRSGISASTAAKSSGCTKPMNIRCTSRSERAVRAHQFRYKLKITAHREFGLGKHFHRPRNRLGRRR